MQRSALLFLTLSILCSNVSAQTTHKNPFGAYPRDRIVRPVDDERRVALPGNLHPQARSEFRIGGVPADFAMDSMVLILKPDPAQQAALDALIAAQHDPGSPYYHRWITPEAYGELFGVSETDLGIIRNWLQSHGLKVEEITQGRRAIVLSGTAAQVKEAFGARIQTYKVNGEVHHANENDPEIPQAMSGVVGGLVSLHDFRSQAMHQLVKQEKWSPRYSSGSSHYLTPADFATIYNVGPLYQQGIDGSGQTIAIVGRSNLKLSDVRTFRSSFGLPARDPQIIVNGPDPGSSDQNEESEAVLDVEWSGAVAKNANIKFVTSASTNSTDGVYLSAQYIVNHNLAPVMSVSFGLCEAALGTSGNNFINSLWQQAAAQGITVLVSSGDSGAAGCDAASASRATQGRAINGLCSSPSSTCVGGTQFNDTTNPGLYWQSSNETNTQSSAVSYIPENVWNESGSSGLWSAGGGASIVYAKPSWQTGLGVPADNKRDVPDVSLTAAVHDGYLVYMEGGLMLMGGTSAASPSFAGIISLVVQETGSALGNVNPVLYRLAGNQQSGGTAVFHDVTAGNNSVPGATGYSATAGYDLASGLGSVDASLLVTHWSDAGNPPPSFDLNAAASSLSVAAGSNNSVTLEVAGSSGFSAPVTLSASGLPAGVTASFNSSTVIGSGSSILTLTAAVSVKAGTFPITITATAGTTKKTAAVSLTTTTTSTFTLSSPTGALTILPAKTGTASYTTAISSVFKSAISLSVSGQPSGVTVAFAPASIASPGSGSTKLTITVGASAAPGNYSLTVTAAGGGLTRTLPLGLNVPSMTLTAGSSTVTAAAGEKPTIAVNTNVAGGFNSSVNLAISGLPSGVAASFSPPVVPAPGAGNSTLTLNRSAGAKAGTYKLTITASGGGISKTAAVTLTAK